jgi:acetyl-CoA carboxylase biotin carboxyl carrier protein
MTNESGASPEPRKEALPLDDVSRLVELLTESGVGEIRVRQGDLEVNVKARTDALAEQPHPMPREEIALVPEEAEASVESLPERNGSLHVVRSPVVGTFYRAPAPGEEPYVEAGDLVGKGQTLCIVEAMKLMNEIPAEVSGEVVEVLVENAKGVEYDQPLFRIRSEGPS